MEYVRTIDFDAINKSGADERLTQKLFDHHFPGRRAISQRKRH